MRINRRDFILGTPLIFVSCATNEQRPPTITEPQFLRREVVYQTSERPGTVVVDPAAATPVWFWRTGARCGMASVLASRKPLISRAKHSARYRPLKTGPPGGSGNPLAPRALYLYRNGLDTYFRLHGTVEPWTIGTMVSSGCIRLLNLNIIDLYRRVPIGTKVVVLPAHPTAAV
ncbi:L,D-transpeptidase [Agrobacterium sp. LMR679]|uniref:L,D-transpeptidase n=1 Tax=Agrobacterium sp. LMR679 TaxID=3014335 RepID=UPI003FA494A8